MSKDNKNKKKKPVYYDDGRTIADMSSISGTNPSGGRPRSSFKDQMRTYFTTVRQMFLPMLAFVGGITVLFLILYLILELVS